MAFEALPKERFQIESVEGGERIVIPAKRNWFVAPFLVFWLTMWTVGGVMAMTQALNGDLFLVIWLIFWAGGWLFAASWLGWQFTGQETLAVRHGALERGWSMLGYKRTKRYDASQVKNLSSASAPFPYSMMLVSCPPFVPVTFGSVKWDYGAATLCAAQGLSEAEGAMVVERLRRWLPVGASEG